MSNDDFENLDIKGLDDEFCNLFFSEDFSSENTKNALKVNIDKHIKLGEEHVAYSNLTKYVFYKCDEQKMGDSILDRCQQYDVLQTKHNKMFIKKTVEDIKLAYAQKEYINSNIEEIKNSIGVSEGKLHKLKVNLDRIYAEFVALLGIFTAIAFSIFGGLDVLSSLFSKLEFSRPVITLGFVLVTGSVTAIIIYGIIIVLMDSIYKLTNVSNHQETRPYPISKNLNNWILIILFVMFVVGLLLLEQFNFSKVPVYIFAVIGIIAVVIKLYQCCKCCKSKAGKS